VRVCVCVVIYLVGIMCHGASCEKIHKCARNRFPKDRLLSAGYKDSYILYKYIYEGENYEVVAPRRLHVL